MDIRDVNHKIKIRNSSCNRSIYRPGFESIAVREPSGGPAQLADANATVKGMSTLNNAEDLRRLEERTIMIVFVIS